MSNSSNSPESFEPADIGKAILHLVTPTQEASRIRQPSPDISKEQICRCCGYPGSTPEFPLNSFEDHLSYLGVGYPLFFYTGKAFCLIMLIGSVLVGLPCSLNNLINAQSSLKDKPSNWSSDSSLHRGKDPIWQGFLQLFYSVILIIFLIYLKLFVKKKVVEIDENNVTPSDFTAIVKGLPPQTDLIELKAFLRESGKNSKEISEIVAISPTYNMDTWVKKEKELLEIKKKSLSIEKYRFNHKKNPRNSWWRRKIPTKEELDRKTCEIKEWKKNFKLETNLKQFQGNWVFVTFQKQSDCKEVIKDWHEDELKTLSRVIKKCFHKFIYNKRTYNGYPITIEKAPEPSDILWENTTVSTWTKVKKRITTALITIILLLCSFYILLSIKIYQYNTYEDSGTISNNESMKLKSISLLLSITIIVLNFIISKSIKYFSLLEKPATLTQYNVAVFHKFVGATTVNTVFMLILVNSYNVQSGYTGKDGVDLNWFSTNYGLTSDVCNFLLVDAFFMPLLLILDDKYLIRLFLRTRVSSGKLQVTQEEANKIWTNPEMELAKRSAKYVTTFLVCLLFSPLFPLALPIGFASFLIKYSIDKYLLLRRYSRSFHIGAGLNYAMFSWLTVSLISYAISCLVLQIVSHGNDSSYIVAPSISVFLVALFVLIPFTRIASKVFLLPNQNEVLIEDKDDDFDDNFERLENDYERANPIISALGWEKWIKRLKEKYGNSQDSFVVDQTVEEFKENSLGEVRDYIKNRMSGNLDDLRKSINFKQFSHELIEKLRKGAVEGKVVKEDDGETDKSERIN